MQIVFHLVWWAWLSDGPMQRWRPGEYNCEISWLGPQLSHYYFLLPWYLGPVMFNSTHFARRYLHITDAMPNIGFHFGRGMEAIFSIFSLTWPTPHLNGGEIYAEYNIIIGMCRRSRKKAKSIKIVNQIHIFFVSRWKCGLVFWAKVIMIISFACQKRLIGGVYSRQLRLLGYLN